MVELSFVIWVMAFFFAYIGYLRGFTKEIISTAGIVLGLFALHQFDPALRGQLLAALPPDQIFYIQSVLFLLLVFFAYQTRALVGEDANRGRSSEGRDDLQTSILGGIFGFLNGYMIFGSIWYFLDINRTPQGTYPLAPYVIAPPTGSASADALGALPLYVLAQGPGGNGDLLALSVIGLFIIVLVMI